MTNDDEGEGGGTIPPKNDDVIYEQPLRTLHIIIMIMILMALMLLRLIMNMMDPNYHKLVRQS